MNKKLLSIGLAAATILVLVSTASAQSRAGWPKSVTVGAAPVGGTYFIWAGGFTKLLNDKLQVPGNVESTGGPVHNIQLIEDQKLDFGKAGTARVGPRAKNTRTSARSFPCTPPISRCTLGPRAYRIATTIPGTGVETGFYPYPRADR